MKNATYNGLDCLLDVSVVNDGVYQVCGLLSITDQAVVDAMVRLGNEPRLIDADNDPFYVITLTRD
jgi:hypothetical protein